MQNDNTIYNDGLADGPEDQEPGMATLAGESGGTEETEMAKKGAVKGAVATDVPRSLVSMGSAADAATAPAGKVETPEMPGRNEQQAYSTVNFIKGMPEQTNALKSPYAQSIVPQ
jgi:hypothetical protein